MDRGEKLYPTEVHAILKLNEERYSVTKVAKLINKSRKVIVNLLKDSNNYEKRKSCGRSRWLTARDKRALIRVTSNSSSTAREIAKKAGVTTKVGNVRRLLKNYKHLKRRKLQQKSWLKQDRELCRLQFAEKYVYANKKWQSRIYQWKELQFRRTSTAIVNCERNNNFWVVDPWEAAV